MNISDLKDKLVALIIWNLEEEDDVHVYLGKVEMEDEQAYFINQEKGSKIAIDEEQLSRIKIVSEEMKEVLLNADYALSMNMEDLPE